MAKKEEALVGKDKRAGNEREEDGSRGERTYPG